MTWIISLTACAWLAACYHPGHEIKSRRRRPSASRCCWSSGPFGAEPFPRATPESVGLNAAKLKEATDLLHRFVAEKKIAGAVAAVARRGKLVYLEAAGVQDLETPRADDRALDVSHLFDDQAGDGGRRDDAARARPVRADRSGREIHPRVQEHGRVVAGRHDAAAGAGDHVQDLLLHTSGLNHRTSQLYQSEKVRSRAQALPQFIANIVRVPLMDDPGTRYRYSESPDRGRAADRDLVGAASRPLLCQRDLPAAGDDRHHLLGVTGAGGAVHDPLRPRQRTA